MKLFNQKKKKIKREFLSEQIKKQVEYLQKNKYIKFQFIYLENSINSINNILHNFDFDCKQIGFDGNNFICTSAFVQSLATNTILNYGLRNYYLNPSVKKQIYKYYNIGFNIIVPTPFNVNLWNEKVYKKCINKKEIEEKKILRSLNAKIASRYYIMPDTKNIKIKNIDCFGIKYKLAKIVKYYK